MYKCNNFKILNVSLNKITNYEHSQSFNLSKCYVYYSHNIYVKTCNKINYPDNLNKN